MYILRVLSTNLMWIFFISDEIWRFIWRTKGLILIPCVLSYPQSLSDMKTFFFQMKAAWTAIVKVYKNVFAAITFRVFSVLSGKTEWQKFGRKTNIMTPKRYNPPKKYICFSLYMNNVSWAFIKVKLWVNQAISDNQYYSKKTNKTIDFHFNKFGIKRFTAQTSLYQCIWNK